MYSSSQGCYTATGTHMPHGITQCYLPLGRGDIPAHTPAEAGTRLSDPGGMQGWSGGGGRGKPSCKFVKSSEQRVVGFRAYYILRCYTRPKTITHPGTNRARRALTSFVRRTPLTTSYAASQCYARCMAADGVADSAGGVVREPGVQKKLWPSYAGR